MKDEIEKTINIKKDTIKQTKFTRVNLQNPCHEIKITS
jgi:hypothetical protein